MTRLLLAWDFDSSVVIGCVLLVIAAFMLNHGRLSRFLVQILGIIVLFVALESPIDALADSCLFSAHMLQHMLLVLIVPPLLMMGISADGTASLLRTPILKRLEHALSKPLVAGVAGMGVLYAWHWPPWYDAALRDEWLHIAEHLSFLIGATIFWWPVLGPRQEQLMSPVVALLYLFIAMLLQSVLGIVLTFMPVGTYRAYLQPDDRLGLLDLVRRSWGITPALDQQIGGLLMWVLGGPVFLAAMLSVLFRWYQIPESRHFLNAL